jgi:leader peptidase (prepilin peptidase)/N-methyltransferase
VDQAALDTLRPLFVAWSALLGGVVGSFLNVVIARVPAGLSVVSPRSRCPRCLAPIAWYDNVPVLSWLWLRARCRGCGLGISIRYPLVECLGAAVAVLAVVRHGPDLRALAELGVVALLMAAAFIDLDTWLLPHVLTVPLIVAGLALAAAGLGPAPTRLSSVLGGAIGFGAGAALSGGAERLRKKEALGVGDVFLLGGLGTWLGVGALLPIVLLASVQGAVVGVALILLGRSQPGPEVEEAPVRDEGAGPEAAVAAAPVDGGADEGTGDGALPLPAEAAGDVAESPSTPDDAPEEDDWVPPRHAVPFGPFLVGAALQWLYLGDGLARWIPAFAIFR